MIVRKILPSLFGLARGVKEPEKVTQYESYSQALKVCTSDGYQNTELCSMIADKTVSYSEFLTKKPFSINPTDSFLLSAIYQYINSTPLKSLTVADFGGACGAHYFEIKRFIPTDFSLRWYVIETPQMVKAANDRNLGNDNLSFVSSIESINTNIDFIHSSGALQYVSNPYEVTQNLLRIMPDRFFVNRMMFNENDNDIVTIQKSLLSSNGPGKLPPDYVDRIIAYPHTTMSFHRFNSVVANAGYEPEWIFEEPSGSYQIKGEKIIGRGMLYVKK